MYRKSRSLPNFSIDGKGDDKAISESPGFFEMPEMPNVKDIKTAVREHDILHENPLHATSLPFLSSVHPISCPLLETDFISTGFSTIREG